MGFGVWDLGFGVWGLGFGVCVDLIFCSSAAVEFADGMVWVCGLWVVGCGLWVVGCGIRVWG